MTTPPKDTSTASNSLERLLMGFFHLSSLPNTPPRVGSGRIMTPMVVLARGIGILHGDLRMISVEQTGGLIPWIRHRTNGRHPSRTHLSLSAGLRPFLVPGRMRHLLARPGTHHHLARNGGIHRRRHHVRGRANLHPIPNPAATSRSCLDDLPALRGGAGLLRKTRIRRWICHASSAPIAVGSLSSTKRTEIAY